MNTRLLLVPSQRRPSCSSCRPYAHGSMPCSSDQRCWRACWQVSVQIDTDCQDATASCRAVSDALQENNLPLCRRWCFGAAASRSCCTQQGAQFIARGRGRLQCPPCSKARGVHLWPRCTCLHKSCVISAGAAPAACLYALERGESPFLCQMAPDHALRSCMPAQ